MVANISNSKVRSIYLNLDLSYLQESVFLIICNGKLLHGTLTCSHRYVLYLYKVKKAEMKFICLVSVSENAPSIVNCHLGITHDILFVANFY